MNWQEARAYSIQKLEPISKKLSDCYELSSLCSGDFTDNYSDKINSLRNKLEKQLDSLRKGEFNIAVVGLEKAGKSTLLNAFLNVDILPNDPKRCTYTTTEVRAVRNNSEQRVEIEFKSIKDFEDDKNGLIEICAQNFTSDEDKKKYTNDLDEIKSYESKIKKYINDSFNENSKGIKIIPFDNIKDIKDTIKPFIEGEKINFEGKESKDTSKPRAVKKITIFTIELLGENELVMHDVPGWDSPVVLHKNLAKEKLSQADSILFVTNISDRVSLKEGESSMMEIASNEDPDIKVKDKVFVFLNKADGLDEAHELNSRYNDAIQEWSNTNKFCTRDRIILGSARAYLTKIGEINSRANDKINRLSEELQLLKEPNKISLLDDGIEILRDKLKLYLNNERTHILLKRCEKILSESEKLMKEFVSQVESKYPEKDVQDLENNTYEANELIIKKWWINEWEQVKKEFANWYYKEIIPQEKPDDKLGENLKLKELQNEFNKKLDELGKSWILTDEGFNNLYKLKTNFAAQPQKAHIEIRDEIIKKAYIDFEEVSYSIAKVTEQIIEEILEWINNRLFGIKKCRNLVEEKTTKQEKIIEFGCYALLHRFSKPAFEVFLRNPRGTGDRNNLTSYFKNDIQILESFYKGKSSNSNLTKYLEIGEWIASNIPEPTISNSVKLVRSAKDLLNNKSMGENVTSENEGYKVADNLESIKKEIREDINSLIDYLKNSVFYASGITNFCYQEFNKIKESFYSLEDKERLFEIYLKREILNNNIPEHSNLIHKSESEILRKKKIIGLINNL
ncbi:MAG: dynamin family protein [Candidatus Sericytochromatia bacterium]